MRTKEEIAAQVKEIFRKTLKIEPDRLEPGAHLKEDLKLDSLDVMEVVYEVEAQFEVQIPEERLKQITTFGQVVDGLHAALETQGG